MKKFLLTATIILSVLTIHAQSGSWKICVNKKTVLETSKEDAVANIKTITSKEWKRSGNLEIAFTESEKDTWNRSFLFYDKEDNELLRKDSTTNIKVTLTELKKLYKGKKEIIIYTTVSPKDPSIAIRMRRVHLCTLRLP